MKNFIKKRIEKLLIAMESKGCDTIITDNSGIINYVTGFYPEKDKKIFVTLYKSGKVYLYMPKGSQNIEGLSTCEYESPLTSISNIIKDMVAIESKSISCPINMSSEWFVKIIRDEYPNLIDSSDSFESILCIKDEAEIENIKDTLKLNTFAYDSVKEYLKVGISEIDIYNVVSSSFNKMAGKNVDFISDIVSGIRASEVSGAASLKKIEKDETLIVDILPNLNGYYSDTTRTFFTRKIDDESIKIYQTLIKVMDSIKEYLHPGVYADEIYNVVNKIIEDSGYKDCFPHHAGHGIGIGFYEPPIFLKGYKHMLEPNMVVTIEPGIYIPNKVGIRIENDYVIRPDGCECIFDYKMGLDDFII